MYERLVKQQPLEKTENMTIYAAAENPEIDVAKLIHFGIGIFWKASVCSFGKGDKPRIDLGEGDREAMRRFLLGEAELPKRFGLGVAVESGPVRYTGMIDPYPGDNPEFKNVYFYVPGMMMQLYIRDDVHTAKGAYAINLSSKAPILLMPLAHIVRGSLSMGSRGARKTKKLMEIVADVEARGLAIKLD